MTYKCAFCQRTQTVDLGHPLPSGSWTCTDVADCASHIITQAGTDG